MFYADRINNEKKCVLRIEILSQISWQINQHGVTQSLTMHRTIALTD